VLLHHQHIELLVLELTLNNCNLLCALLYRPPSSDPTVLSHLEDTLDAFPPNKINTMVLLGDFNIDLTTHTNDPQLVSLQAKHGLTQIISSPTRTMQSSATIIDHVYVSEHLIHSHSIMSPLSSSDHSCVLLSLLNRRVLPTKPCQRKVWLYQRADFDGANDTLIDSPFEPSSSNSVDSVWDEWYQTYMRVMNDAIPTRRIKRINNLPYLTSHLQKLIRKKHCLYKAAKQLSTSSAWSRYRSLRNHVTSTLRSAKSRFYQSLSNKINSPREFWKNFHKLAPKTSRIAVDLHLDNHIESTSLGKANLLNHFFVSCFTKATLTVPSSIVSQDKPTLTSITVKEDKVYQSYLAIKQILLLARTVFQVTCFVIPPSVYTQL